MTPRCDATAQRSVPTKCFTERRKRELHRKRGPNKIAIRTYERGVEDETLACGTGIVASALTFAASEKSSSPITVLARGGDEPSGRF